MTWEKSLFINSFYVLYMFHVSLFVFFLATKLVLIQEKQDHHLPMPTVLSYINLHNYAQQEEMIGKECPQLLSC